MNYWRKFLSFILLIILLGCSQAEGMNFEKAGLLLSHRIDDQGWNTKAYQGILNIQSSMDVQVYVKEDVKTFEQVKNAIKEFDKDGVTLIFGHSYIYAEYFMELKDKYPHIHFVNFNGDVEGTNITSLHFEGYSMGYFAGILSSDMTKTNQLGIIAAFPFQPEVEGFLDGVSYNNSDVNVHVEYVDSWINSEKAINIFYDMEKQGVDIFYPAGDGFHVPVVEEVKSSGLFAIGYVEDHIDLGSSTILTSTVQHVEKLYEYVAKAYQNGSLESGNLYYDFAEGVITLGEYGQEVPEDIRIKMEEAIKIYIESGDLPNVIAKDN